MTYVDGFVTPAKAGIDRAEYAAFAERMADVIKEHGALRVVEAWGDDVPDGDVTDFRKAVHAEAGETVVFSWIEWPDKATRDAGMAKAMEDPRMQSDDMPFVGKRLIYGGFQTIVER